MCYTSAAREPIIQARALCGRDLDCEQSLFFFRFSESNARARERRSRPYHAISHARGHLRVSRFARRTTEKRETACSLDGTSF